MSIVSAIITEYLLNGTKDINPRHFNRAKCASNKALLTVEHRYCIIIAQTYYIKFDSHYDHIHTYIIGHYNRSVRITAQLLPPLMLCALILYISSGSYSLTLTLNNRFLGNFFMAVLFTLSVFARYLLRGNRRRNTGGQAKIGTDYH